MTIELTTQAGTTTITVADLREATVRAALLRHFAGQFVELSLYRVTRPFFEGVGPHVRGYVREGGTEGGRVLGSIRLAPIPA